VMQSIVNAEIESYVSRLGTVNDPVLTEMEALAGKRNFPIVGPQVGRLLEILARFGGARRVLELGSGFGYSAWWFTRGLAPGGIIHCTDLSQENRDLALGFFRRAGRAERIVFHVGEALQIARGLNGVFDIVFNDVDKEAYPDSLEVALSVLRTGGLFLTDNVLWSGKVTEDDTHADPATAAIKRFNKAIFNRRDLLPVILPMRDGLAVCVKK